MKPKKLVKLKQNLQSKTSAISHAPTRGKLPLKGEPVKGTFVRFTQKKNVLFKLDSGHSATMDKSYLMWFDRPCFKMQKANIRLKKNAPPLDLEIKVGERKKTGRTNIRVGHFYTGEYPWDNAKKQHPKGSRAQCVVKEFVGQYSIVEFPSGFWGWLPNKELSWTESKEAIDLFARGKAEIEVVVIDHLEPKHRLLVSYRKVLSTYQEKEPPSHDPQSSDPFPVHEEDEDRSTATFQGVVATDLEGVDEAFEEGSVVFQLHRRKERNPKAVRRKREIVLARKGKLACEACDFDFIDVYGALGKGFAECHHRIPLATLEKAHRTRLSDLAILCANCHRMIHRSSPMLSVEDLRKHIKSVCDDDNYEY